MVKYIYLNAFAEVHHIGKQYPALVDRLGVVLREKVFYDVRPFKPATQIKRNG